MLSNLTNRRVLVSPSSECAESSESELTIVGGGGSAQRLRAAHDKLSSPRTLLPRAAKQATPHLDKLLSSDLLPYVLQFDECAARHPAGDEKASSLSTSATEPAAAARQTACKKQRGTSGNAMRGDDVAQLDLAAWSVAPPSVHSADYFAVSPETSRLVELYGVDNSLFLALARALLYKCYYEDKNYELLFRTICLGDLTLSSQFRFDSDLALQEVLRKKLCVFWLSHVQNGCFVSNCKYAADFDSVCDFLYQVYQIGVNNFSRNALFAKHALDDMAFVLKVQIYVFDLPTSALECAAPVAPSSSSSESTVTVGDLTSPMLTRATAKVYAPLSSFDSIKQRDYIFLAKTHVSSDEQQFIYRWMMPNACREAVHVRLFDTPQPPQPQPPPPQPQPVKYVVGSAVGKPSFMRRADATTAALYAHHMVVVESERVYRCFGGKCQLLDESVAAFAAAAAAVAAPNVSGRASITAAASDAPQKLNAVNVLLFVQFLASASVHTLISLQNIKFGSYTSVGCEPTTMIVFLNRLWGQKHFALDKTLTEIQLHRQKKNEKENQALHYTHRHHQQRQQQQQQQQQSIQKNKPEEMIVHLLSSMRAPSSLDANHRRTNEKLQQLQTASTPKHSAQAEQYIELNDRLRNSLEQHQEPKLLLVSHVDQKFATKRRRKTTPTLSSMQLSLASSECTTSSRRLSATSVQRGCVAAKCDGAVSCSPSSSAASVATLSTDLQSTTTSSVTSSSSSTSTSTTHSPCSTKSHSPSATLSDDHVSLLQIYQQQQLMQQQHSLKRKQQTQGELKQPVENKWDVFYRPASDGTDDVDAESHVVAEQYDALPRQQQQQQHHQQQQQQQHELQQLQTNSCSNASSCKSNEQSTEAERSTACNHLATTNKPQRTLLRRKSTSYASTLFRQKQQHQQQQKQTHLSVDSLESTLPSCSKYRVGTSGGGSGAQMNPRRSIENCLSLITMALQEKHSSNDRRGCNANITTDSTSYFQAANE